MRMRYVESLITNSGKLSNLCFYLNINLSNWMAFRITKLRCEYYNLNEYFMMMSVKLLNFHFNCILPYYDSFV